MMDPGLLTVGYRDWRGGLRGHGGGGRAAGAGAVDPQGAAVRYGGAAEKDASGDRVSRDGEATGDCIDCVNACPMGIDIREGQQMACITCALSIDACDEVMARIGRPGGLIDYLALDDRPPVAPGAPAPVRPKGTEARGPATTGVPARTAAARDGLAATTVAAPAPGAPALAPLAADAPILTPGPGAWRPKPVWRHVLRPRTLIYTAAWAAIGVFLVVALCVRPEIDMTAAPVRNPTFATLSDGSVRDAYALRLRNEHGETRDFRLPLAAEGILRLELEGRSDLVAEVPGCSASSSPPAPRIPPPPSAAICACGPRTSSRASARMSTRSSTEGRAMTNASATRADRPLTGARVAAMFVGGFGVIVAANVALAVSAVRTFPGVETRNVYALGQTFEADRAARDALGWDVSGTLDGDRLRLAVTGPRGGVRPEIVTATFGRATTTARD